MDTGLLHKGGLNDGGKNKRALTVRANNNALRNRSYQVSAMQRAEVGKNECI